MRPFNLHVVSAAVLGATALGGLARASEEPPLFGSWARGDGKANVRIEPCGTDICATNIWVKPDTPGEKIGDVLVMSVKPVAPARWEGTAFDPQRNLRYKMIVDVGQRTMTSNGCILAGLLCKDMGWTRLTGGKK